MNATTKGLFPFLLIGMFAYAGCAKHELVKKDEGLVPATAKQATTQQPNSAPAKGADSTAANVSPIAGGDLKDATANDQAAEAALKQKLQTIYFGFDSSALTGKARAALVKNLEVVKGHSGDKVRIEGYCDERGSDEYNLALGERRAQAAAKYLVSLGVGKDRLTILSYGNEKPADPGHNEAAWSKNRRDEFVFVR